MTDLTSTGRTVDALRLRKELEFITAHRERWHQGRWVERRDEASCGTVACLAGNTVINAGYRPVYGIGYNRLNHAAHVNDGTVVRSIGAVAEELLGLSAYEADLLFHPCNTLLDLWLLAEWLTDGEVEVPESVAHEHHELFGNYHGPGGRRTTPIR